MIMDHLKNRKKNMTTQPLFSKIIIEKDLMELKIKKLG